MLLLLPASDIQRVRRITTLCTRSAGDVLVKVRCTMVRSRQLEYSATVVPETIADMPDAERLRIQGRLQVIEITGPWGAYAGERIVVGPGDSFRDDLGIKIREMFQDGAAEALAEGRSPSEQFELANVRITIEVVPRAVGA
jgi:hypothetical protein